VEADPDDAEALPDFLQAVWDFLVAPTGFEPVFSRGHVFAKSYMALALDSIDASAAFKARTKAARMQCRWGDQMLAWSPYDGC